MRSSGHARREELAHPFEVLETRSWRIAKAIEATTRRSDVRTIRSKIVLLLLSMRCPTRCAPRKSWYVPGAVARVGPDGLHRLWKAFWGEEPPSLKTFRRHLGMLECAGVLIKAPGDWLPIPRDPQNPARRPTYAQTFHLLETDDAAEWWATDGKKLLEKHPRTRTNPDRFRMVFADWRKRAAKGPAGVVQEYLWEDGSDPAPAEDGASGHARTIEHRVDILREIVCRPNVRPDEIVVSLDRAGLRLRGPNRLKVQRNAGRLRGVAAMAAIAIGRGDKIRKPGGWIFRAFGVAPAEELTAAIAKVEALGWGDLPPLPSQITNSNRDSSPTPIADLLDFFSDSASE